MADQSTQSITVSAPPEKVMAVIADFDAYPEWAGSVKSATVTKAGSDGRAERVAFKIEASAIRDEYELAYSWDGDRAVSWTLVSGQMQKSQQGSYSLKAVTGGTEVTYSLAVDLAIPMLGMLKRKAEKVIMDTALKELKKQAER
ncbi:SRPBCC family protein [Jatrophihabitans telluris]|uniref:SRPBCC family protein n=1 Tax=Jatrophihabitans telluris TaxID=2038343 RepID=A0ABY4QVW4_9ACTN|nr:SRPBCC family protein [Jatrophihabitans telluris]UQX87237.1 SRPBCC family protein [Jatrophihabitans telluris]